jgi:Tc toxin complex TcA C-terminal TcB-binding domain
VINVKYFHGHVDTYQQSLGNWKVTQRERTYEHTVQYARRVIYRFTGHTHPYAQRLVAELLSGDVGGLQRLDTDVDLRDPFFTDEYAPGKIVAAVDPALAGDATVAVLAAKPPGSALEDDGLPVRDVDFDYQSAAYAVYNWESFFHAPNLIALHLSRNGRYAEAQRWFHYIFDPTDNSDPALGPKRFWKFRPFRIDEIEHVEDTLFNLATGDNPNARDATARAIGAWRDSPFRPHLVARTRPTAYMYATVMAYLDNLIAWGDSLFRQDTRESINEATQLYVLAANVLGQRPQSVPRRGSDKGQTYATLKHSLDEFSNAAVRLEPEIAFDLFPPPEAAGERPEQSVLESVGRSLFFCIPRNDKLLGYWDTVADRLFKIRNSLNLQGIFRPLPLFAPPIDPAMLARAVAAGVDVGAIVDGTAEEIAPVRFQFLLQKALELAQEVRSLEGGILAALEKKDGEVLGVLRARHEVSALSLAESVKYAQWQEAVKSREGIQANLANAFQRFRHYDRLLGTDDSQINLPPYAPFDRSAFDARATALDEPIVDSVDPLVTIGANFRAGNHKISDEEGLELNLLEAAQIGQDVGGILESIGAFLNLIPNIEGAVKPWGLGVGTQFGGSNLGMLFQGLATVARGVAGRISHEATMAGRMASFARREQDWAFQRKQAAGELTQLFKQVRSAELREHVAQREHENHKKQIKQSQDVLEFLTNEQDILTGDQRKTTTADFYLWMKRESQGLHAKCFQFAFDVARRAERAFQHELGAQDRRFIQMGYLAGKEGLSAGEKLLLDLKRLEMAYADLNTREYEITKQVSLREWFPLALIELRNSGSCTIGLPEALFDLDCPGHSFRRIRSVGVSIPAVTGNHVGMNCSLTLTQSHVRRGTNGYGNNPQEDTTNFTSYPAAVTSIVTSFARDADAGLFDPNQRDERYLPFEGAGAISSWSIELLGSPRPFDYDSITDLILTLRYTARAEGNRADAEAAAKQWLEANAAQVLSMRHEFATQWAAFKRPIAEDGGKASLVFSLDEGHFPYRMRTISKEAKRLHLFFAGSPGGSVELARDGVSLGETQLVSGATIVSEFQPTGSFELRFESNAIDDLWLVVDWTTDHA